ncbi:glucosamine-6-phosphate deaminase [Oceanospirillaceae bacterium]|nr:glucosamine-6-phosphate deaminase [Oceanospirillaceae bacterium]
MRVVIAGDASAVASASADILCQQMIGQPRSVLGLATGSTPVMLYRELVRRYRAGLVCFSGAKSFNLDEYVGIDPKHHHSYCHFMKMHLFDHIDIEPVATEILQGLAEPNAECQRYEAAIKSAGGIDLQVLGLGANGHIGFNEPTSSLASRTRIKTLTEATVDANARFFKPKEQQPSLALTMGIGTIMEARHILLLATGEHKAKAVKAMVEGPVCAAHPASVLQFHHTVTVILDVGAASLLDSQQYFHWVEKMRSETTQLGRENR